MDTFLDLVSQRESCRAYADTAAEHEKLTQCFEAARLAPSACNAQPYEMVCVQAPQSAAQVAKALKGPGGMNGFAADCGCFVVIHEAPTNLSARVGARRKDQDYTSVDIGIAAAHFCLAATDVGLSTCIVGWFDEPALKTLLGISEKSRIRLVVCIGYAKTDAARPKKRKALDAMVRFV